MLGGIKHMKYFAYILIAVGILNFTTYLIILLVFGGDAINGKVEAGKYYLCEHGRYTEVSRSVFEYSRFHTYSVWITVPLGMLGICLAAAADKKDRKTRYTP
jgi:hypothetical protein